MARKARLAAFGAVKTAQPKSRPKSSLLALPSNVRLEIFRHLFTGVHIRVCSFDKDHTASTFAASEICQILLTCRKIHSEAAPLMFELANLHIEKQSSWDYISRQIQDQKTLALVTKITFKINKSQVKLLRSVNWALLPRLQVLYVEDMTGIFDLGQLHRAPETMVNAVIVKLLQGDFMRTVVVPNLPLKRRRFAICLVVRISWWGQAAQQNRILRFNGVFWEEVVQGYSEVCLVNFDKGTIEAGYRRPIAGSGFEEVTLYNCEDLEETMRVATVR